MKKLFLLLLTVMTLSLCASAQTRTVQGTVVDAETDEPLVGVSVQAGKGYGVATDIDGNFSLKVPESTTQLEVSYVGYKSQVVKITNGKMTIRMHAESELLNEVIAVAYGQSTRAAFTGSAAVVGAAELENAQVSNPLNAIKGKVAGVQMTNASGAPGQDSPTIRIRGISSINAGNAPLIILDGVPYEGSMQSINTNDIETMTVLKDAASNALYGARGANGVILITTKKAKAGDATITFDMKLGQNARAQLDYNYITNPAQYYETYFKALNNYALAAGMNAGTANAWANNRMFNNEYPEFGLGYNIYTVPNGQTLIGLNGKLNPNATLGRVVSYNGEEYFITPDSWMDAAYHNALRQEYNLSIAKGSDNSNYYLSVGYLDNAGITPQSGFKRLSTNFRGSTQAKSWLKVSANVRYSHYEIDAYGNPDDEGSAGSTGNPFAAAQNIAPIYPLFVRNGDGSVRVDENGIKVYDFGAGNNAGMIRPAMGNSNPIGVSLLNSTTATTDAFSGNASAEIRFLKDFTFTANQNVDYYTARQTNVDNPYYGQSASTDGALGKYVSTALAYTMQQMLNWSHRYGMHNVSGLVVHEYYNRKTTSLSGSMTGMFDPNTTELSSMINLRSTSSSSTEYNNEGWIFRALYDYDNRYFANASYRRDASSRFHPQHRWGNFWSASAAWIISSEDFMDEVEWVNMLKLKASYGSQGNDNIGNFLYTNCYAITSADGEPAITPYRMGNEKLTWETNGNFNAGFEFGLFDNKLSGSFEGFYRKTTDMLFYFQLPPSIGWSGYYANVGDMANAGVEIDLHGTVIKTKDWEWGLNANFTWYKNRITRLPDENKVTTSEDHYYGFASGSYFYTEGQPIYNYYMPKFAGVDKETGESIWYKESKIPILDENGVHMKDKDGEYMFEKDANGKDIYKTETTKLYTEASKYCMGQAMSPIYGGFGTNLSYKDFDLSVSFDYAIGGQCYDGSYAGLMGSPTSSSRGDNIHADILNAWTPENPNSNIPKYIYGDPYVSYTSSRFLTDASYLSLSNIALGYTLPSKLVQKAYLKGVRVYVNADNVWLWSKRQGLDPRQSISGANSNTYYSPIRTISGGLTVTF